MLVFVDMCARIRRTGWLMVCAFVGFATMSSATSAQETARGTVVVIGDSIAAGSGVDLSEAFPARLQERVDRAELPFQVINAGLSGDTTAGGVRRLNWLLRRDIDVLIIELGGNDALRGVPVEETKANIGRMIDSARKKYPDIEVIVTGMQIFDDWGPEYTAGFKALFHDVAKEKETELVPFLLEGMGGLPEFNQDDKIHPNPKGHEVIAETVWKVLEPVLNRVTKRLQARDSD